jgi:hypothetical protein
VRCIPKSELHDHPSLKETSHNVTGWRFPKCCRPQNTACVRTLDVSPSHRIPIDAKQGFGGTGYTQHRATNILHTYSSHTFPPYPITPNQQLLQHVAAQVHVLGWWTSKDNALTGHGAPLGLWMALRPCFSMSGSKLPRQIPVWVGLSLLQEGMGFVQRLLFFAIIVLPSVLLTWKLAGPLRQTTCIMIWQLCIPLLEYVKR